jgi:hypothetical protein
VRAAWLALLLALVAEGAVAELAPELGPALTAEAFEALTLGRTLETEVARNDRVLQKFLSGKRAIWRDAEGCKWGHWQAVGAQICITYDRDPQRPQCWLFKAQGAEILGWYQGDLAFPPLRMRQGSRRLSCEAEGI